MINKKHSKTFVLAMSMLFVLVGCNNSSNNNNDLNATELSGLVTYEDGTPTSNTRVVAMNRKDNQAYKTTTDSEGHYSMTLPHGNYDLGSDDANGKQATIQGPIAIKYRTQNSDIKLPVSQEDNLLTGTLFTTDNTPAIGYRLHITSSISRKGLGKLDINTTTDANGMFRATIVGQHNFDLDIYDPEGKFVEFVDLHKLDGGLTCHLTFSNNENKNIHRHDEPSSSTLKDLSRNQSNNRAFSFMYDEKTGDSLLYDGELTVGGGYIELDKIGYSIIEISKHTQILINSNGDNLDVNLVRESSWWYDYKIIFHYGPLGKEREYHFTDKTGDVYSKDCIDSHEHTIAYNSDDPTIDHIVAGYPLPMPHP